MSVIEGYKEPCEFCKGYIICDGRDSCPCKREHKSYWVMQHKIQGRLNFCYHCFALLRQLVDWKQIDTTEQIQDGWY